MPLADVGAEFLFQVISGNTVVHSENGKFLVTIIAARSTRSNPILCKALLDRITDRALIIETGTESFRFMRTIQRRKQG